MDLSITGRHPIFFDDDTSAAFVNSREALVEWNNLLIDRYDVRHLLSQVPPPVKRRPSGLVKSDEEDLIDQERYLDLPDDEACLDNTGADLTHNGSYKAVDFSYGSTDVPAGGGSPSVSGYLPPFPVPEPLLQNLPPTEKLHQIMSRTAMFVSKHGGQSEIVLRVKQGNNPTFGFLMPDNHLHPYFRFLVDHPEVWNSSNGHKPYDEKDEGEFGQSKTNNSGTGALSLLGSAYESGDDEDAAADGCGAIEAISEPNEYEPGGSSVNAKDKAEVSLKVPLEENENKSILKVSSEKTELSIKNSIVAAKEKDFLPKKPQLVAKVIKPRAVSLPPLPQAESLIVEPPSQLKVTMDKIVEFVLRNGKDFEAVLIQQDSTSEKFPFLVPSNVYHAYYLKVLQKAQESKQAGKTGFRFKDTDSLSNTSASLDLPCNFEKKEKFTMVISGPKKEPQDPPPKPSVHQHEMSMDDVAAILQAATRGVRIPNFNTHRKTSSENDFVHEKGGKADSSEAHMTKEQKLKAERLKRAKMFAAKLKSGGETGVKEALPHVAVDPPNLTLSPPKAEVVNPVIREREGSSALVDIDVPQQVETFRKKETDDGIKEQKTRKYRVKSKDSEEEEGEIDEDSDHKRSRKKHRSSRHSSHHSKVEDDEEEEEDSDHKHSRKRHRLSRHSSHHSKVDDDEENSDHKHSSKSHRSSRRSSRHSRDESKHRKSERKHKHHDSSEDEHRHHSRSHKHRKTSNSDRDANRDDTVDQKIQGKSSTKEASVTQIDDHSEKSTAVSPEAQSSVTEVPEDLRAKVRAMLLATM